MAVCNVVLGRVQRAATEFYMALPVSYMDFSNVGLLVSMINQGVRGANIGRSCVYHTIFLKNSPADIL